MKHRSYPACAVVYLALAVAPGLLCAQDNDPDQAPEKLSAQVIQIRLLERAEVNADDMTLQDVLARLSALYGVPIRLDDAALKRTKFDVETRFSLKPANISLNTALRRILNNQELRHVAGDGAIVITDAAGADDVAKRSLRLVKGGTAAAIVAPEAPAVEKIDAQEKVVKAREAEFARRVRGPAVNEMAVRVQGDGAPHLRPLLAIERRFLSKVCSLTAEQEAELRKQEEAHLREISRKYRAMIVKLQRGTWKPADGSTDLRRIVLDVLASEDNSVLSEDQLARYRKEGSLRAAARRSAAARSIVAMLDEHVVLSANQRDKILESLMANWNDIWAMSPQLIQPGNEQIPEIPGNLVDPFLTSAQRKAWSSVPKQRMVFTEVQVLGLPLQEFANEGEPVAPVGNARPARAGKDAAE